MEASDNPAFIAAVCGELEFIAWRERRHCRPTLGSDGPSGLTFLGHAKDSLWSVDPFRVSL